MSSLMETLMQQLQGDRLRQIGQAIGADETQTRSAVSAALPALFGALSRNASKPEGAAQLLGALRRDHDGGVLDDLEGFLPQAAQGGGGGAAILQHVLGGGTAKLAGNLSRTTGLDASAAGKLLAILAPLVMGALGRQQRQGGLDVAGLTGLLVSERAASEKAAPGMLGNLLDADGDGDVDAGDLAERGKGLLGKMFGGN